jgi:metal-sulfur cluster biosynthetic enzyme
MTTTEAATPAVPDTHAALMEALREEVIDPDLGVNIVDLGFIRAARIDGDQVVVLAMTLTSPACPLTKIIEAQARAAVVGKIAGDLRIEWVWTQPWTPADVTPSGREQLSAIGFSFGAGRRTP